MKTSRNAPCPCGSGKKFKHCCGGLQLSGQGGADSQQQVTEPIDPQLALLNMLETARYAEAERAAQALIEQQPQLAFGWKVLGFVYNITDRKIAALAPMQKAAELAPDDAEAHRNLGIVLQDLGRIAEAETSYLRALQIDEPYAKAHSNLGKLLCETARFDAAKSHFSRALQIDPDLVEAHDNLGVAHFQTNQLDAAEACFRHALTLAPKHIPSLQNLIVLKSALGKLEDALPLIEQLLEISESQVAKSLFASCIQFLRIDHSDRSLRTYLLRALTESWARPGELAKSCLYTIKTNRIISECIARAVASAPQFLRAEELFGETGMDALNQDSLLLALLIAAPICDIDTERFLTLSRQVILTTAASTSPEDSAPGLAMDFYTALSQQCFINEYVFFAQDDELKEAQDLREKLISAVSEGLPIPALWLIGVACYFPLYQLPVARLLLDMPWTEAIARLITQQIREPLEEQALSTSIPRLTSIADEVSLLVQSQYEEHPYPRWVHVGITIPEPGVLEYLRKRFPLVPIDYRNGETISEILIAGCGTGQHSIQTATRHPETNILAIDLSLSSISYAERKRKQAGISGLLHAQADILQLGSLDRSFDLIESVGVLHHLADPLRGWRVLVSLLRPGGFMRIGLYSEIARRDIAEIQSVIAEQHYGSSDDDIRAARQLLLNGHLQTTPGSASNSIDFYSLSACRDLLFHCQEHRFTLEDIASFLHEQRLSFLGFELENAVFHAYRQAFPDDPAATNLNNWGIFEQQRPDTFLAMYQFWVQKAA